MSDLPYDFIDVEQPERKPAVQRRVEMKEESPEEERLRCEVLSEVRNRDVTLYPESNTDKPGKSDSPGFFSKVMQMIRGAF